MNKKEYAFTLIELIVVITVVLILSLIALPNFNKSKQKIIEKEGIATIKLIAAAERIYRMEQGFYADCSCNDAIDCASATGCNPILNLMLNAANWGYGSNASGNITATGKAPGMTGCTYKLIPSGYDNEPSIEGSCP